MRVDSGITNVPSAGTAVQVSNVTNRVKYVVFKALAGNSGLRTLANATCRRATGMS